MATIYRYQAGRVTAASITAFINLLLFSIGTVSFISASAINGESPTVCTGTRRLLPQLSAWTLAYVRQAGTDTIDQTAVVCCPDDLAPLDMVVRPPRDLVIFPQPICTIRHGHNKKLIIPHRFLPESSGHNLTALWSIVPAPPERSDKRQVGTKPADTNVHLSVCLTE